MDDYAFHASLSAGIVAVFERAVQADGYADRRTCRVRAGRTTEDLVSFHIRNLRPEEAVKTNT